jgi:hypothetical protein
VTTQPGYQERALWWRVAKHLDEARLAAVNAMAHNVDDPSLILALHDRLREGQALLLEIFRAKGLLPAALNGAAEILPPAVGVPVPVVVAPAVVPESEHVDDPPEVAPAASAAQEAAAYEEAVGDPAPSSIAPVQP